MRLKINYSDFAGQFYFTTVGFKKLSGFLQFMIISCRSIFINEHLLKFLGRHIQRVYLGSNIFHRIYLVMLVSAVIEALVVYVLHDVCKSPQNYPIHYRAHFLQSPYFWFPRFRIHHTNHRACFEHAIALVLPSQ